MLLYTLKFVHLTHEIYVTLTLLRTVLLGTINSRRALLIKCYIMIFQRTYVLVETPVYWQYMARNYSSTTGFKTG